MRLSDRAIRQLCIRARQGSPSARDQLLREHIGLVVHRARSFHRNGAFLQLDDLIQQGCLGLLHAIQKFDPFRVSRGRPVQFGTYAHFWINHCIRREIQNKGRMIAVPVGRCKDPQPAIVPLEQGAWLENAQGEAFARIIDLDETSDRWCQAWDARRTVETLLAKLPRTAQAAMRHRFGLDGAVEPLSRTETGKRMGISGTRIGQLERAGLQQLREYARFYSF